MKFFKTVKFRITFYFALTFACASLLCFLIVLFYQYSVQRSDIRERLEHFQKEFRITYLTAGEFKHPCRPLSLKSLPKTVELQHLKPILAYYRNTPDKYTVIAGGDGKIYALTVNGEKNLCEIPQSARIAAMNNEFNGESYGEGTNRIFFLLLDKSGKVLTRSPFSERVVRGFQKQEKLFSNLRSWEEMVHRRNRDILTLNSRMPDGNILVTGYNLHPLYRDLRSLAFILSMMTLVITLVGALTGWFLSMRIMRGVDRVSRSAMQIAKGDFSQRVEYCGEGEEVEHLVESFNTMAQNTEEILTELKTISGNIAHDLRTPITRMRGKAELAVSEGRGSELAYDVAEECGNMLSMINTMLEITRLEAGAGKMRSAEDLAELCREAVELFSTVAEDKSISLSVEVSETLPFSCARVDIQRLLANLLDNALKFTPSGKSVKLTLRSAADGILLQVSDSGTGIPFEDQPHILERFYRADSSRSLPGNGLGLSLVAAIVKSYNGALSFESVPGEGTCFTIHLPNH